MSQIHHGAEKRMRRKIDFSQRGAKETLNKDILPLNLASDRPPSESLQNYFHHAKNTFKRIVHGCTGGGIGWKLSNYQGIP